MNKQIEEIKKTERDYEIYALGMDVGKIEGRKEVAKEILQELFKEALNNRYGMVDFRQIKAHAKKYGVEVNGCDN